MMNKRPISCLALLYIGTLSVLSLGWLIQTAWNHLVPNARIDFSLASLISSTILFLAFFIYSFTRKKVDDEELL